MTLEWIRLIASGGCLILGMVFMVLAVFGVNRFRRALNRMHAAAMGDTLGILFVFLGLVLMRGFSMDSLKLVLVILFFWIASPVSGHMISRLEVMTNEHLGELLLIHREKGGAGAGSGRIGTESTSGAGAGSERVGAESTGGTGAGSETAGMETVAGLEKEDGHEAV